MKASEQPRSVLVARIWPLAIMLSLLATASAFAQSSISQFSRAERIELEKLISVEAQGSVNRLQRLEGQSMPTRVMAKFDDAGKNLLVEVGRGFIPEGTDYTPARVLDQLRLISNDIRYLLDETIEVEQIIFLFDGKNRFYYFPQEAPKAKKIPATDVPPPGEGPGIPVGDTVVVSASHGLYRLYQSDGSPNFTWVEQRDPYNGVIEDYLTPSYATEIEVWLEARSDDVTVRFPRTTSGEVHIPSTTDSETHFWWQVAARYYLEQRYPNNPGIWNTHPGSQAVDREYDDDINARPEYANHINAHALISLHTNGATTPNPRGTRAYHDPTDAEGERLGTSILCYMKEIIQSQAGYENWIVQENSIPSTRYGENNEADMQAIIVETGFHTNPDDALALQDPVFRAAAMRGVEKGYRLKEEGKPCEPFQIDNIPDVTGPQNQPVPVKVHYKGYPQFAVKAIMEILTCPSGWDCSDFAWNFTDEAPSPLSYTITCSVSSPRPAATFRVRTTLIDIDGVTTSPVEHNFTCTPATQSDSGAAPAGRPSISIGPA